MLMLNRYAINERWIVNAISVYLLFSWERCTFGFTGNSCGTDDGEQYVPDSDYQTQNSLGERVPHYMRYTFAHYLFTDKSRLT